MIGRERRVTPLVLTGDNDLLIAPQNSLTLAKYLCCACIIIKDSGHMMYVEHPQLFANILHKHFRLSREKRVQQTQQTASGWYEDDVVRVVDYTHPNSPERHRRLSTISSSLSSSSVPSKPTFLPSLSSLQSLLTFFFLFKLISALPQLHLLRGRMIGSFSEVVRPIVLLHRHIRSLLMYHLTRMMALIRAVL